MCTQEQAEAANLAFDNAVRQYLLDWIAQGTVPGSDRSPDALTDSEEFVEQGALRQFFKHHHDDALELLLQNNAIARHLMRPASEVCFSDDHYEPLLARFERRIYNLAAHREHLEVPFRYSPASRQGDYGDSIGLADLPPGEGREDIGYYFGTRRSDPTALALLGQKLSARSLAAASTLPVHIITKAYMTEAMELVKTQTTLLQANGDDQLHAFIIQTRHAADDRHLGAALLLMDPAQPGTPQRILFCDTLNPGGTPPWWHSFGHKVDAVFPQAEGETPVSARLEDAGVKLQRLHDGVPVRHQDIDCAFYTYAIADALIQLAAETPELLVEGTTADIVSRMTERMTDYYVQADIARSPETVREANVLHRWNSGRDALLAISRGTPAVSVA
ncbi:hypothetical protein HH216_23755 [Spirosoma rhododendri]|uniref:Uncharacterized protein n=1 Tax=Spirosoma rhododendri TaxID=2728024 RepID=A0A7L5DSL2_9BACT|nr:hypothetical protein HH216_23755 [Spirosoma rhododendri]